MLGAQFDESNLPISAKYLTPGSEIPSRDLIEERDRKRKPTNVMFCLLELGHKKISRGVVAHHPGVFEDSGALIRCLEPFFSSGGLQILMFSNPCRIHRDSIPLPRSFEQHSGSLPSQSPRIPPPSRKQLTPARKSSPPGLSPSIHLAISTYIIIPEHTATTSRMAAAVPFPTSCSKDSVHCLVFLATKGGRKFVARSIQAAFGL